MTTITSAGYIIHNNEAIWAVGSTRHEAWGEFADAMRNANVRVVLELDDEPGSATRITDYHCRAASADLIANVEAKGGNISWHVRNGIACSDADVDELDGG